RALMDRCRASQFARGQRGGYGGRQVLVWSLGAGCDWGGGGDGGGGGVAGGGIYLGIHDDGPGGLVRGVRG
ncbi:hypothetical protein RA272_30035, partial [Pseudomonas syringae pv. tagetis]